MSRIKIILPEKFSFITQIPIRVTDINYGNHVGNDSILSILHEARMQFLNNYGYTEKQFEGVGMIMRDAGIEFLKELFYGDTIYASIAASGFSRAGFDIYYKLEIAAERPGSAGIVAVAAKTGMICYDYDKKKIVAVPEQARIKLLQ